MDGAKNATLCSDRRQRATGAYGVTLRRGTTAAQPLGPAQPLGRTIPGPVLLLFRVVKSLGKGFAASQPADRPKLALE